MGLQDHLICLLKNLYVGQEATLRNLYAITDWFRIEEEVPQGCLLSPCLFNLYTKHIMRNARLDELPPGINISGRDINILRYTNDTTLMAKSKRNKRTS